MPVGPEKGWNVFDGRIIIVEGVAPLNPALRSGGRGGSAQGRN